ncbi:MAG TPA: CRTAC1 family protein [Verrucomicrobiae bacterium]|nr:CRTAC1 family protein [Verrucomicrobiae bacterium]
MSADKSRKKAANAPEADEMVHLDDAVIGRALKRSAILVVLLAAAAAGIYSYLHRKPPPPAVKLTPIATPVVADRAAAAMPKVQFTDVTAASGISFRHFSGATGDKLLPETMGGGVSFIDFDNDGDPDLLFVNGADWPWAKSPRQPKPTPALFRNDGHGRFEDVTAKSGLDVTLFGMGAAVGDFDNDGLDDLLFTAVGGNRLFRNLGGGKFSDVSDVAGVRGNSNDWSTCAAFLDIDNDGDLDLFVGNYVKWSKEIDLEVGYKLVGVGRAYGQPMNFEGTFPYLFRNEGGGRFKDISKESGVRIANKDTGVPASKSLGVAPVDLNQDGWIDFIVANDTTPNTVFTNAGDGTFKEIGGVSGIAFDANGQTRGAMGIDAARYRSDAALGVVIGNFANEMTALYVSQTDPCSFVDEAIAEGVGPASRLLLKFGIFFFDYDLDGRLDLLSANGHLEEEISKIQKSQQYAQPAQLFWNSGAASGATFVPVPEPMAGADLFRPIVGRGSAFADIDGDGDLDVVLAQVGGAPLLLRNDQHLSNHWVRLKLVGRAANRSAIGAWIRLRAGSDVAWRQVMPTRSYLSQSELPVTIGVGKAAKVDELEIIWPGGQRQTVADLKIDRMTVIEQPPKS